MYLIHDYQIVDISSEHYLLSARLIVKLSSQVLVHILMELNQQEQREISETKLLGIAQRFQVDIHVLKQFLIVQHAILRPLASRKVPSMYLNCDDPLVEQLIGDSLKREHNVNCCEEDRVDFQSPSLVIFYRKNYSSPDFKHVYESLQDGVYLITCGVLYQQLIIDNIYFKRSGLPTHASNFYDLMRGSSSEEIPGTNLHGLSFYRELFERDIEELPALSLSTCQRGYIAYAIEQFLACYVKFDGRPTPFDAINWRWQVDLLTFGVQKNIAILNEDAIL